jgi:hypothetical protein
MWEKIADLYVGAIELGRIENVEGFGTEFEPPSHHSSDAAKKAHRLSSYSDMEVLYMGVPYPRSKLVDEVRYFRTPRGEFRPFPFQKRVQYRPTATFQGSQLAILRNVRSEGFR